MKLKVGDFARLEEKLVQITKIRLNDSKTHLGGNAVYDVQIKLHNDKLRHWVDSQQLQPVTKQLAPKVLFG